MALLLVKSGVQPKLILLLAALANTAQKLTSPAAVYITSGIDGRHSHNSRHYGLEAVDVRSKNFPSREAKLAFLKAVLERLGAVEEVRRAGKLIGYRTITGYFGFLEAEGTANEHFHLQFDR